MKYEVALYHSDEGVAAQALILPGCWSQGETKGEAIENIIEAIREYLDADIPPVDEGDEIEVEITLSR